MDKQKDSSDSSNNIKRTKLNGLTITVLVFVAILLAGLIIIFFAVSDDIATQGVDQNIRLSASGGFECEYAEAQKLYPFSEGVIKVTGTRVSYLTVSGSEIFGVDINYQNPYCLVNGSNVAVADINGYGFSVYNTEGLIYSKNTDNQVKHLSLSDNGSICVTTSNNSGYGLVSIYDSTGESIGDFYSNESGFPVSCAFNEDTTLLSCVSINTNGTVFLPVINQFSLYNADGSVLSDSYAVYSILSSDFVSKLLYCDNILFAFSEDTIYSLDSEGSFSALDLSLGVIDQVFTVGNRIFVLYSQGVGQLDNLAVLDTSGNILYDSPIGTKINSYAVYNNSCVLSIDNRIFVIDSNGNIRNDFEVDEDVIRVGFLSADKLVVVSTGGVHTINL